MTAREVYAVSPCRKSIVRVRYLNGTLTIQAGWLAPEGVPNGYHEVELDREGALFLGQCLIEVATHGEFKSPTR